MSPWNLAAVAVSALSGMVLASLVLAVGTARVTLHLRSPAIGPAHEGAELPQLTALKLAL
jgi:hypothetical protein